MASIEYTALTGADLNDISDIHNQELKIGVLQLFGTSFFRQMYANQLNKGNWGFVAKADGVTVGYILATHKEISLFKCLSIQTMLHFLFKLIKNPSKTFLFFIAFKEFYLRDSEERIIPTKSMIELSWFAVKSGWKGKGIGRELIQRLEEKAKKSGFSAVFSNTHNERLLAFYVKNRGAKVIRKISIISYNAITLKWEL